MQSIEESILELEVDCHKLAAMEIAADLSTNKAWVTATSGKRGKRGPSSHIPTEGRSPESGKSLAARKLENVSTVIKQLRLMEEDRIQGVPSRRANPVSEARRKAVLKETDVDLIELCFLYGYTDPRSVKELRIRHGRDEHSGRVLQDGQRPLISTLKRVRKS